jgi:hypothetical protein
VRGALGWGAGTLARARGTVWRCAVRPLAARKRRPRAEATPNLRLWRPHRSQPPSNKDGRITLLETWWGEAPREEAAAWGALALSCRRHICTHARTHTRARCQQGLTVESHDSARPTPSSFSLPSTPQMAVRPSAALPAAGVGAGQHAAGLLAGAGVPPARVLVVRPGVQGNRQVVCRMLGWDSGRGPPPCLFFVKGTRWMEPDAAESGSFFKKAHGRPASLPRSPGPRTQNGWWPSPLLTIHTANAARAMRFFHGSRCPLPSTATCAALGRGQCCRDSCSVAQSQEPPLCSVFPSPPSSKVLDPLGRFIPQASRRAGVEGCGRSLSAGRRLEPTGR